MLYVVNYSIIVNIERTIIENIKATFVIFLAASISPSPIAAPTNADIAEPIHIGTT